MNGNRQMIDFQENTHHRVLYEDINKIQSECKS